MIYPVANTLKYTSYDNFKVEQHFFSYDFELENNEHGIDTMVTVTTLIMQLIV